MKRTVTCLVVVALALTFGGCSRSTPTSGPPGSIVITATDAGRSVEIAVNGTITVALPANLSTGYSWVPTATPAFLKQQGEPSYQQSGSPGLVGAGGTQMFQFKATDAGSGVLALEYRRPFETTATPETRFLLKVEAK
jgi:inhibitor of cysteine peptidase